MSVSLKDLSKNGECSTSRIDVSGTAPSGGLSNVSKSDNSAVMMNKPELAARGSRADDLIEMAGDDTYRLGQEPARKGKIKG